MPARFKCVILAVVLICLLAGLALLALRPFGIAALMAGVVACGLGMRHAFDADHIATIDNVTRRLRQRGQRPAGIGFLFSLGHSTVVTLLILGLALAFAHVHAALNAFIDWGVLASTLFSALILTSLGLANLGVFRQLVRRLHKPECGMDLDPSGMRAVRPWPARAWSDIDCSWKMYPVGMLFGLGFDTATEVTLLAISAGAVQSGHFPLWAVLAFPLLFTAGMCLMDTLQSLLMLRMYDWAVAGGDRSLKLNTFITGTSMLFALGVAGIRWADLANMHVMRVDLSGSSAVGLIASGIMLVAWLAGARRRRMAEFAVPDRHWR